MTKKISKREVVAATKAIEDRLDYIVSLTLTDGYREANAFATFGDTPRRMADCIGLLIRARAPLPERIISRWRTAGTVWKWHAYNALPPYVAETAAA